MLQQRALDLEVPRREERFDEGGRRHRTRHFGDVSAREAGAMLVGVEQRVLRHWTGLDGGHGGCGDVKSFEPARRRGVEPGMLPDAPCHAKRPPYAGVASFSPTMPATIRPRLTSRPALADSPNSTMPSRAVPTAPTPTQTA